MFVEVGFGGVLANLVETHRPRPRRAPACRDRASFDGCLAVASATDSGIGASNPHDQRNRNSASKRGRHRLEPRDRPARVAEELKRAGFDVLRTARASAGWTRRGRSPQPRGRLRRARVIAVAANVADAKPRLLRSSTPPRKRSAAWTCW